MYYDIFIVDKTKEICQNFPVGNKKILRNII